MQRLLVRQQRRDHDAEPDGELAIPERRHRAQQACRDGCKLGREAERIGLRARGEHIAGDDRGDRDDQRRGEDPGRPENQREPAAQCADQREQDERAQAADREFVVLALVAFALDAEQRADQQRGGEIPDDGDIDLRGHGPACTHWVRGCPA